jgi:hypothetical protein
VALTEANKLVGKAVTRFGKVVALAICGVDYMIERKRRWRRPVVG